MQKFMNSSSNGPLLLIHFNQKEYVGQILATVPTTKSHENPFSVPKAANDENRTHKLKHGANWGGGNCH